MQKKTKKAIVLVLGIIFIILGFFGLVLPFLQGILFLVIGFLLLSYCFPQVRLWADKHLKKYPHLLTVVDSTENWLKKIIGEI